MANKTKAFLIRFSEEEIEFIKSHSVEFKSVAAYIRAAVAEFSDIDAKKKYEAMAELANLFRKFRDELSWIGGNLNQAQKRANELQIAGLLTKSYIHNTLLPNINETKRLCKDIKEDMDVLIKHIYK